MSLIGERMAAQEEDGAEAFLARNQDLMNPTIILSHYSQSRLNSALTRAVPRRPDCAGA
jgi:hypothetical protein